MSFPGEPSPPLPLLPGPGEPPPPLPLLPGPGGPPPQLSGPGEPSPPLPLFPGPWEPPPPLPLFPGPGRPPPPLPLFQGPGRPPPPLPGPGKPSPLQMPSSFLPPPADDHLPPDMVPTSQLQSQSQSQSPSSSPPPPIGLIVGAVVGGLVLLVVLGYCIIWYRRRKVDNQIQSKSEDGISRPRPQPDEPKNDERPHIRQSAISGGTSSNFGSLYSFAYEELAKATDSFSKTNFLGEGGYGSVHKGILPEGKRVAIKQLRLESKQGEKEFMAEVEIINRVHHKNLVSLAGYCISEEHKILVYEFVPNGTLHLHLHGKEKPTIDWPTRMKIALGSANGLAYLHEDCHPQIIHRDIKAANILLDDKFVVKVADFGLATYSSDTKSYVSTAVKGTWGYLDPAYLTSEKLTDKADIFSFGVVLLELITGREPKCETELLYQWAKPLLKQALENGNFHALIDPRLQNESNSSEMRRMVACAAACVRHSASDRPKMSQIVRALEGNLSLEDLNGGIKPGDSGEFGSYASKSYDTNQRNMDLKKYNKLSQEDHKEDTNEQSEPSTYHVSTLQTAR